MMLSTPTPVDQLTAGGSYPHADCGEADLKSCLVDAGHYDSVAQVEQAIGGNLSYGTNTVQLHNAATALGLPTTLTAQGGEVDAALSRKHRIIVEIPSDHMGNPLPGSGLGHFILVYGFDGSNYHYMNPLGGRIMTISPATLIECERERGYRALEIGVVMPRDAGAPAPSPAPAPAPTPAPAPAPAPFPYGNPTSCSITAQSTAYVFREPMSGILHTIYRNGVYYHVDGWKYGPAVWDASARQNDRRWYHIFNYGWVASALVFGNAPGSTP